ncbi:pilus assembly protein TadG-related protein [Nesterenkonia alba]|uniref:pilus assembly protein TadG-related protein n=1 Tax=Nesterenkonia alba TaxID=515814 RepID=UPI0003B72A85|nr:pilus assembly protein TadG-related protein [Nesterenkonia alba]
MSQGGLQRRGSTTQRCSTAGFSDETGKITILTVGMVTMLLMLSAVVIGAATVTVETRQVLSAADGAASAAAEAAHTTRGPHPPVFSSQQARAAAEDYLQASGATTRHSNLQVRRTWTSDGGETIHVELGAVVELPVLRWVLPAEVPVSAESHARLTVER